MYVTSAETLQPHLFCSHHRLGFIHARFGEARDSVTVAGG